MDSDLNIESEKLHSELQSLAETVRTLAESCEGDSLLLLALLRTLESLHREVRDGLFQSSLPDNRQALYNLLKDIEASGGWPYIHRMKLRSILGCDKVFPLPDGPTESCNSAQSL